MIDLTKTFDVVDHAILIPKLSALGIPNNILIWIVSFLSDRSQIRNIKYHNSNPANITMSNIQGLVLEPTHYIIIEGNPESISAINTFFKHDVCRLQNFNNIKKWAEINRMHLNLAKTKEVVFRCLTRILILFPCLLTP